MPISVRGNRLSTCLDQREPVPAVTARLVCAFTLLPTSAAAQSTTEDGIRAMLRGEYQAAARILRPLADHAPQPDPVAQFFKRERVMQGKKIVTRWYCPPCGRSWVGPRAR